jgi:hypothetical protein
MTHHKIVRKNVKAREPPPTIQPDNAKSTVAPQHRITQSMTAAKQRENICILEDADRTPWKNNSAVEITTRVDDPDNSGLPWHCLKRSKETELNVDRKTSKENGPAVAIADYTNKPNNNSISWNHFENDKSIDEVNSSDDNDQETTPTNATVPHRPTPLTPHQLDISSFTTQNTHGLSQQPCDANGKPLI